MANTIQIKRSSTAADMSGQTVASGELAWVDHGTGGAAGILYIGDMTGAGAAVRKIGGPGWGTELLTNSALTGVPTAPTAAAGTCTGTRSNVDAATAPSSSPASDGCPSWME